ncbi:MAG: DUF58 domain-containing protein [Nitrospinae bacterium]|nr:DUF58 domain-containing protein [Nitrospinota bacterium]
MAWLPPLIATVAIAAGYFLYARRKEKSPAPETAHTRDILKKVRTIEFASKKAVEAVFSGEYHSAFKGRGMAFAEVRPYAPGDDVRSIDWNVTARMGEPFIKIFEEERELTVILAVDASASGAFGTARFKSESAAEICAAIAFSAIRNNDKVGLLVFTDKVELNIPPRKGRRHVLRIIRELVAFSPSGKRTNIKAALDTLNHAAKKRAIVFLVSDFNDAGYETSLRIAAKKHDLVAVRVTDPAETEMPDAGLARLRDPETGEEIMVDTSHRDFRARFSAAAKKRETDTRRLLAACRVDLIEVSTGADAFQPLEKFFQQREKRLAGGR